MVGCYNYTGTPYVGKRLLPEVVYAYGLKEAIDNEYLKQVKVYGLQNVQEETRTFVHTAIKEFWEVHKGKRYEGMLPKFAFFASTINELQNELKPVVEEVLTDLGIPISSILVNVGDDRITTNDDLREFRNLDRPESDKQFILLVNKGKEGWNCRSLFGVGLHRKPKSKVFVLQATMRCLRSISDIQQEGMVYLSDENIAILDAELEENFNLNLESLNNAGTDKETIQIKLVPPPVKIKLKRVKTLHQLKEKELSSCVDLELENIDHSNYTITRTERDIRDLDTATKKEEVQSIEQRQFSRFTLVAEIARYLYHPKGVDNLRKIGPLEIRHALEHSKQGINAVLYEVNAHNKLLYDWVIPRLFNHFYSVESFEKAEEEEIELVKPPKDGYYSMKAKPELVAWMETDNYKKFLDKSFHLDYYCFDSVPEKQMFDKLLQQEVEKVWFTGMLTHGQSDFHIKYIDPESNTVRSYYPDFLVKLKTTNDKDEYVILEVKGDNKIDDAVVQAKAKYASQLAGASGMRYEMIKGSEAQNGIRINSRSSPSLGS